MVWETGSESTSSYDSTGSECVGDRVLDLDSVNLGENPTRVQQTALPGCHMPGVWWTDPDPENVSSSVGPERSYVSACNVCEI